MRLDGGGYPLRAHLDKKPIKKITLKGKGVMKPAVSQSGGCEGIVPVPSPPSSGDGLSLMLKHQGNMENHLTL